MLVLILIEALLLTDQILTESLSYEEVIKKVYPPKCRGKQYIGVLGIIH